MAERTTTIDDTKLVQDLIAGLPTAKQGSSYPELLAHLHGLEFCTELDDCQALAVAIVRAQQALADAGIAVKRYRRNGGSRLLITGSVHPQQ